MARHREGGGLSPMGAVVAGKVAGAVGTLAMDLFWYALKRRDGETKSFGEWELSAGLDDWQSAPAPAQVGKRLYEGMFQRELPPSAAALTSNLTHWATGTGWGVVYGVVSGSRRTQGRGVVLGLTAWATSYAALVPAGLYEPPWTYDATTLSRDIGSHLVYGVTTALTFRLITRRRR